MGCGSSNQQRGSKHQTKDEGEYPIQIDYDVTNLDEFFFPDFPTPALLQKAQEEFSALRRDHLKILAKSSGLDTPHPTTTPKRDVFFLERYSAVDQQAISIPESLYRKPIKVLAASITRGLASDLEKVRAIFRWVASLDVHSIQIPDTVSADTTYHHLKRIQLRYDVLTMLLSKLCNLVGIKSIVVKGIVKGGNYEIGMKGMAVEEFLGRWSIVEVDSVWRIVDVFWGSRHTIGGTDDWLLFDDNGKSKVRETKDAGLTRTVLQCDERWFLPDPEAFIYTHFPIDGAEHQLLARPVTQEEFECMAFLEPPFFDLNLSIVSHPKCLLHSEDGEIRITIGFQPKSKTKFAYQLYIDSKFADDISQHANDIDSNQLKNFVIMCQSGSEIHCDIVFPIAGRYKFNLYASGNNDCYKLACSYVIQCDKAKKNAESTPDNTRNVWGPGGDTEDLGMVPVSHESGVIDTDEPCVEIRFRYDLHRPLRFLHALVSDEIDDSSLFSYAFHRIEGDEVVYTIRLPECGIYAFNIFANFLTECHTSSNVCNYLIRYRGNSENTCLPFPKIENGELGASRTQPEGKIFMTLISHESAYMKAGDNGEINITFKTPCAAEFSNTLNLQDGPDNMIVLENFIQTIIKGTETIFHIIFPKPGIFHFEIFAKAKGQDGTYSKAYNSLIEVEIPKENCFPFPKFTRFWDEECDLIGPHSGYLQTNQKVTFEVIVPKAKDIAVTGLEGGWQHLHRTDDGIWRGDIDPGEKCTSVNVSAKTDENENAYHSVLQYEVLKEEDIRAKMEEMKKVKSDAQAQTEVKRKENEKKLKSALAEMKANLLYAVKRKDLHILKKAIKEVENRHFTSHLTEEMSKARKLLASLQRIEDLKFSVVNMDAGTMAEIRRYTKPPEGVHQVMIASLLILGDSEKYSQKWQDCQVMCNSLGKRGLYRRVNGFDVEGLRPEIAERARKIISKYQLSDIKALSAGAGTFYVWVSGMIEEAKKRQTN